MSTLTKPEPARGGVVLALHRLDRDTASAVMEACQRASAGPVPWTGNGQPPSDAPPFLVIAGLPPGERRVPDDLLALCTGTFPGLPMLLLCEEPLVKPTVSLHDGRIVLMGPPLTAERIHRRLCVLRSGDAVKRDRPRELDRFIESPGGTVIHEQLRPHWWVAGLSCAEPTGDEAVRLPLLYQEVAEGLTAVIALSPDVGEAELVRAVEVVNGGEEDPATMADRLAAVLGTSAGVVHLCPRAEEWLFYWPREDAPLSLFSPLRLPAWWDLAATAAVRGSPLIRMQAFARDLVVAMSGPPPSLDQRRIGGEAPAGASDPELNASCHHGGPSVLELLESRVNECPQPFAAALTEVR